VLRAVNRDNQSVDSLVDLKPIVTDNREIGLTHAGQLGSFTVSAYDSRSELGSQVRVTNGIGSVARVPIQVRGVEFSGEVRPHEDLTLSATYAITHGKTAIAEGAPLDVDLGARSQGPRKVLVAARWAITPAAALRFQVANYGARHINEGRFAGTAKLEEHFSGYTIADLGATWATRFGEFGLGIENVFDRQYIGYFPQANPGGTNQDYFAGHGRTYTLSWRRTFE